MAGSSTSAPASRGSIPTKVRVRRYEVTVEPGSAVATTELPPAPGLAPGPYVAETYEVSVERQNVIVDMPG